jgi:hypothetical protein
MRDNRKQRVFIPVMLAGVLAFGSVAAEASPRHRDSGDRAVKGAVIGATLGTLLQLATGHAEGRDVLGAAVVGGALGAAAGAADGPGRYHRGGYVEVYPGAYPAAPYYGDGYAYRDYDAGYRGEGHYRESRRDDRRYDRDSRRGERRGHRHSDDCRH